MFKKNKLFIIFSVKICYSVAYMLLNGDSLLTLISQTTSSTYLYGILRYLYFHNKTVSL